MKEEIIKAKEVLRNAGYFVDNLWHIHDVYVAADGAIKKDQARQVLEMALTNNDTTDQIWLAIKISIDILNEKP
jgi:hypothetical protein